MTVKAQPKSRRLGIQSRTTAAHGACLRIGIKEVAEGGRANRDGCTVLAEALHVPASMAAITLGQAGRDKTLHVAGDAVLLIARLKAL